MPRALKLPTSTWEIGLEHNTDGAQDVCVKRKRQKTQPQHHGAQEEQELWKQADGGQIPLVIYQLVGLREITEMGWGEGGNHARAGRMAFLRSSIAGPFCRAKISVRDLESLPTLQGR